MRGELGKLSGKVDLDDKHLEQARVEATIDAASIDTGVEKRDAHLRSPDFFDTAKFPTITFKSTEVKRVAGGKYRISGNLTMHGVTRPVALEVESAALEVKDPMGNVRRGAVATTTLDRKDFGLGWNKVLEAGGVVVGDTVQVTIDLSLTRKDHPSTASR